MSRESGKFPIMGSVIRWLCLVLGLTVAGTRALAQEVGSKEWLEQALETAADAEIPAGTYFEWRHTAFANGTQRDLDRLTAELQGKPEHPLRQQYEELKRRLSNGGDVTRYQIWMFDAAHWRISEDTKFAESQLAWRDAALNGDDAWRLIPNTVTLLSSHNAERGFDVMNKMAMPTYAWRYLMAPGVGYLGRRFHVVSVVAQPDWQAELARNDGKLDVKLSGRLNSGTLRIEAIDVIRNQDLPDDHRRLATFNPESNGQTPPLIPGLTPAEAMETTPPPNSSSSYPSRWELLSVRPVDESSKQALLATPTPGATDPVRSLNGLTGIIDRTRGEAIPVTDGNADRTDAVPLPESRGSEANGGMLRIVVAIALTCAIAALVLFRFKSR